MTAPTTAAVLDLGSNTFHLLVARRLPDGNLATVYRERVYVKLAAGGGPSILPAARDKGLATLRHFRAKLNEYGNPPVRVLGTAMLRQATNGAAFMAAAAELGLPVELLSGPDEARLIARGVRAALPPETDRVLVMDIGGGSTEFIVCEEGQTLFARSFPLGLARLHRDFQRHDPFTEADRQALYDHLTAELGPLRLALAKYPTDHLVGSAGVFEVLLNAELSSAPSHTVEMFHWRRTVRELLALGPEERGRHPAVPPERSDYLPTALLLADFAVRLANAKRLTVSSYALKEGALLDG